MTNFTVPGLTADQGAAVANTLQNRLSAYNDLHLTLKHIHWNVVGPNFIGVHEMIDPQVDLVRGFADAVAERIAALGASPQGTPGAIEKDRSWDDYSVGRDSAQAHLAALDLVYTGVIEHRSEGDCEGRRDRPDHRGHADRSDRGTGEVPVVRPCPPRELRGPSRQRGRAHREEGRGRRALTGTRHTHQRIHQIPVRAPVGGRPDRPSA